MYPLPGKDTSFLVYLRKILEWFVRFTWEENYSVSPIRCPLLPVRCCPRHLFPPEDSVCHHWLFPQLLMQDLLFQGLSVLGRRPKPSWQMREPKQCKGRQCCKAEFLFLPLRNLCWYLPNETCGVLHWGMQIPGPLCAQPVGKGHSRWPFLPICLFIPKRVAFSSCFPGRLYIVCLCIGVSVVTISPGLSISRGRLPVEDTVYRK